MARAPYTYALDLLAARAYTARNLRRKLLRKEFDPAEIDSVMERLTSSGLLDDRRYAAEFARQKLVAGFAVRRVKQELMKRGIDGKVAGEAIGEVEADEPVDTEAAIERLARKKLRSLGDLDREVKRRRVFGALARRGYDLDEIKRVISRVIP